MKMGEWSVFFGDIPINCWFPKYSYFDGKYYEKRAIIWFGKIIEFSREKDRLMIHKNISKKDLDIILKDLSKDLDKIKKDDYKYRDKYYD